jgi:hypothetical protein
MSSAACNSEHLLEITYAQYSSLLFRVTPNAETQLGPGKTDLLHALDETGSIASSRLWIRHIANTT